jgi:hypothetical protein
MEYKYVDESKAPAAPKLTTGNTEKLRKMVEDLPLGKVAVVTPAEGQSIRGMKTSIGRIASTRSFKIQQWQSEDGKTLYVKKLA